MTTREITQRLRRIEQDISILHRRALVIFSDGSERRKKKAVLEETAGALKGKIKGNLVTWQKKVRSEWDRPSLKS